MRLTSTQVERTLRQFDGQAIPDNHPVLPQLNRLFGDHTFFLDGNGPSWSRPSLPGGVEAGKSECCQLERCQSHQAPPTHSSSHVALIQVHGTRALDEALEDTLSGV